MTSYHNDTPQTERRAVLKSDRDARNTLFARAQADADAELGGRWAKPVPTTVICGAQYPAASASHADPVPPEAPLGFAVDAMEPVGTPAEVQRSIERNEVGDAAAHAVSAPGPASAEVGLGLGGAGPTAAERKAHRQRDFQSETVRRA